MSQIQKDFIRSLLAAIEKSLEGTTNVFEAAKVQQAIETIETSLHAL